jgi:serine/threonine protein kinase
MAENWKLWEGRTVNGLPLRRYLGGSEHAGVFLTERGGQQAAIKLFLSGPETDPPLSSWQKAAGNSRPGLITIFDSGRSQVDGTQFVYCVMEYAEENLSQILPDRSLTADETSQLIQSILATLNSLHARGDVHGHVKPSNIFAIGDHIKLSSDTISRAGQPIKASGTPGPYDPPELASGGTISPAYDAWGLGMLIVEALTQHPPSWNREKSSAPPVPTELPASFSEIVSHCLKPDPQERWTVEQIAARLNPVTVATSEKSIESATSNKPSYITVGIAIVVLAVALIAIPRITHRNSVSGPSPSTPQNSKSSSTQNSQPTTPPTASPNNDPIRGTVAERSLPSVPRSAANTIQGKIKVRMRLAVSDSGNVVATKFESRGPSPYFANLALKSAKQWKFIPPKVDGKNVLSEWELTFEFARNSTDVVPTQKHP